MIETKDGKKSLLEVTRENYIVPKGEEQLVHYIAEKVLFDGKTGKRLSHPDLIKTDVKLFESVMLRNLELQDYSINIVYHPEGKYIDFTPAEDTASENARLKSELEEMKAKLAEMEAKASVETAEAPVETKAEEKNKGGRPKKNA